MTPPPSGAYLASGSASTSGNALGWGTVPYYADEDVTLLLGDTRTVMESLPAGSVSCIVTSPPYYGLRDYGQEGQYGLEDSPAQYVETMRATFAEARRVLADDGTFWLNLGDSYVRAQEANVPQSKNRKVDYPIHSKAGSSDGIVGRAARPGGRVVGGLPVKNLLGIPWRVAFALQDDGWILRNAVVWHKPNAMPTSVTDRLGTRHELIFMFSKQPRYWFDLDAIKEPLKYPEAVGSGIKFGGNKAGGYGNAAYSGNAYEGDPGGRNPGDVWSIPTQPYPEAHFAVFPMEVPLRCIKAGCKPGGTVLDPFSGSGTTGAAARNLGRKYVGIDLNPAYHDLAKRRFTQAVLDFGGAA